MGRSWLMHCATSRKVAGSNSDDVIGILRWHNPSDRTIALGSTHSVTEMSSRNISCGVKGCRCVGVTALPPSCADCLKIWDPASPFWNPEGLHRDCFTFTYACMAQVTGDIHSRYLTCCLHSRRFMFFVFESCMRNGPFWHSLSLLNEIIIRVVNLVVSWVVC
jgi:hypothetical protein